MTCKDCLHFVLCGGASWEKLTDFPEFTPRNEWVHLPCKVGTQVFFLWDKNIIETSVEKIIFKGNGCYIKLKCNAMYETSCQSIGKTVFFTRESAKKALAERRKE